MKNPVPVIFKLKIPLLEKGRQSIALAQSNPEMPSHPCLSHKIICFAKGQGNVLHAHDAEEHSFLVLQGAARFYDEQKQIALLERNEAILIPIGFYYRVENAGDGPLVLYRVGASVGASSTKSLNRVDRNKRSLLPTDPQNNYTKPKPIEGEFYE